MNFVIEQFYYMKYLLGISDKISVPNTISFETTMYVFAMDVNVFVYDFK